MKKEFYTTWIVWGTLVFSIIVYVVFCHFVGKDIVIEFGDTDLLKNIMFVLSVASFGPAWYIKKFILNNAVKKAPNNKLEIESAIKIYLTASIITWAICESAAIFGLMLYLLSKDFTSLYSFIAISLIGMIYFRPKYSEVKALTGN